MKKINNFLKKIILSKDSGIAPGIKEEVREIAKAKACVIHNPVSNMKLATGGYTPLPELMEANATITLGTDGAASNNKLDMFETMKFAALIQKQHRWDPQVLPAQTVFDLATINGAEALHMDNLIGSIEEGKKEDIIIIDMDKPRLTPCHDPISHLVYAANGDDVYATIVNGKILMLDKKFYTLDAHKIMDDAIECAEDLTTNSVS